MKLIKIVFIYFPFVSFLYSQTFLEMNSSKPYLKFKSFCVYDNELKYLLERDGRIFNNEAFNPFHIDPHELDLDNIFEENSSFNQQAQLLCQDENNLSIIYKDKIVDLFEDNIEYLNIKNLFFVENKGFLYLDELNNLTYFSINTGPFTFNSNNKLDSIDGFINSESNKLVLLSNKEVSVFDINKNKYISRWSHFLKAPIHINPIYNDKIIISTKDKSFLFDLNGRALLGEGKEFSDHCLRSLKKIRNNLDNDYIVQDCKYRLYYFKTSKQVYTNNLLEQNKFKPTYSKFNVPSFNQYAKKMIPKLSLSFGFKEDSITTLDNDLDISSSDDKTYSLGFLATWDFSKSSLKDELKIMEMQNKIIEASKYTMNIKKLQRGIDEKINSISWTYFK
ncbi:MAG: hypothetical protein ABIA04_03425 [Pseudomonadota bacterium]